MSLMSKKREDLTPSGGLVKLERVRVTCPACGRPVDAVASDGWVRGFCAISRRYVNLAVDNPTPETAEISASGPDPDEVKDGVVSDYLAGDKAVVIQLKHGVSPGKMYRILGGANVKLRTSCRKGFPPKALEKATVKGK